MDCSLEFGDGDAIIKVLSKVLNKLIEVNLKSNNEQSIVTKFQSSYAPDISVLGYLERIRKYARCSDACFIVALIYIDRIIEIRNVVLTALNIHRILITSVLISAKFFDDEFFNNAFFAKLGGVSIWEMNSLELEFLHLVNFTLFVTTETYDRYHMELRKYIPVDSSLYSPIADYLAFNTTPLLHTTPPKVQVYNNDKQHFMEGFLQRSTSTTPTSGSAKRCKPSESLQHVTNDIIYHGGDTSMTTTPTLSTQRQQLWSDHVLAASHAIILSPSILTGYSSASTVSSSVTPPVFVTTTSSSTSTVRQQPLNSTSQSYHSSNLTKVSDKKLNIIDTTTTTYTKPVTSAILKNSSSTSTTLTNTTTMKSTSTSKSQAVPVNYGNNNTNNNYNNTSSFPCPSLWGIPNPNQTTNPSVSFPPYTYPLNNTYSEKYPRCQPTIMIPSEYIANYPLTLTRIAVCNTKDASYIYSYPRTTGTTINGNNIPYNYHPQQQYQQHQIHPRIEIPSQYNGYDHHTTQTCCGNSPTSSSSSDSLYSPNSVYYENIHNGNAGAMPISIPIGTSEQ